MGDAGLRHGTKRLACPRSRARRPGDSHEWRAASDGVFEGLDEEGRWCSLNRAGNCSPSRPATCTSAMRRRRMLLAVDAGNTNTVFAVFDDDGGGNEEPRGQWRAMTDARRTSDEYAVWLGQLLAQAGVRLADIDEAIVSSVVPQGIGALKSLCADHCGCEAQVVGEAGVALGIAVNVPRPEEVGADRLVNTVGAHIRHAGALIILDFGTATTFDSVSAKGRLRRWHHRAGNRAVAGGAASGCRAIAAYRGQAPRTADCQGDGAGHAVRHLLGLRRADRGYRRAHEGRDRGTRDHGRDRRTGRSLRRCHGRDRRSRSGPHDPGPARDSPAQRAKR